ncbi:hypothetical protein [Kitasatospora sp. NPDC090308]|uniref:phenylalanine--tRNA ligase subunit beta-related protein n=1 Tax=Kitasatospora sp. NPDC090308 TaxID=3364082 RepID=UPI00382A847C
MRVPVSWLNEFLHRELSVREIDELLGEAGIAVTGADSAGLLSPLVVAGRVEPGPAGRPGTVRVAVPTGELVRLPDGVGEAPPPGSVVAVALPGARLFATADRSGPEPVRGRLLRVGPAGHPGQPVGRICTSAELGLGPHPHVHLLAPGSRPGTPVRALLPEARAEEVLTLRIPDALAHCGGLWGLAGEINLRLDGPGTATTATTATADPGGTRPPGSPDAPVLEVRAPEVCAAALLLPHPPAAGPAPDWERAALAGLTADDGLDRVLLIAAFEYGVRLSAHRLPAEGRVRVRLDDPAGARAPGGVPDRADHAHLPLTVTPRPTPPSPSVPPPSVPPPSVPPLPPGAERLLVLATAEAGNAPDGERCRRAVARVGALLDPGTPPGGRAVSVAFGPTAGRRTLTLDPAALRSLSEGPAEGPAYGRLLALIGADCDWTDGGLRVRVPPSRPDLRGPEDLVAELVRLHGLGRIPATLPDGEVRPEPDHRHRALAALRRALAGCRFHELLTPVVGTGPAPADGPAREDPWCAPVLGLAGSGAGRTRFVRRSLVPGLAAAARAQSPATAPHALYELGMVLDPLGPDGARERTSLALLHTPADPPGAPGTGPLREAGYWQVLDAVKALLRPLAAGPLRTELLDDPAFRPGTAALLLVAGQPVGRLGVLPAGAPAERSAVAELDVDRLLSLPRVPRTVTTPARFPEVQRDVCLLLPPGPAAGPVLAALADSGPLVRRVDVLDVYDVPGEHRAVTVRLVLGSRWHTLERREAGAAVELAVAAAVAAGARGTRS